MEPPVLSAAARRLVTAGAAFDAHVDALQRALDLGHDLAVAGPGHFDLERARAGGLSSVVLVCWVDPSYLPERAFERAAALLAEAHALAERRPDALRLVGNAGELAEARAAGLIGGIPGIEGGHALEESLAKLEWFFERGLRVLTLVWNNHLPWIRSCQDGAGPDVPAGLSDFGRDVVRAMNRFGMIVDLSHASERAFYDALDASSKPTIASHSGCHALHAHPRNLTDDQLRALRDTGGVMGIVFHPGFLDADARAEEARVRASDAYRACSGANDTAVFLAQSDIVRRDAAPLDATRLVDHVCHAVEVAGVEHVGIGSDFDGIQRGPRWLEDARGYAVLAELLLARGFDEAETERILGGNMRRVFAAVTGPGTRAASATRVPLGAGTGA